MKIEGASMYVKINEAGFRHLLRISLVSDIYLKPAN